MYYKNISLLSFEYCAHNWSENITFTHYTFQNSHFRFSLSCSTKTCIKIHIKPLSVDICHNLCSVLLPPGYPKILGYFKETFNKRLLLWSLLVWFVFFLSVTCFYVQVISLPTINLFLPPSQLLVHPFNRLTSEDRCSEFYQLYQLSLTFRIHYVCHNMISPDSTQPRPARQPSTTRSRSTWLSSTFCTSSAASSLPSTSGAMASTTHSLQPQGTFWLVTFLIHNQMIVCI